MEARVALPPLQAPNPASSCFHELPRRMFRPVCGRLPQQGTPHPLFPPNRPTAQVAGHRTGFGNPVWRDSHPPAACTAPAVQLLLDAGATLRGKTHMDELAYRQVASSLHPLFNIQCALTSMFSPLFSIQPFLQCLALPSHQPPFTLSSVFSPPNSPLFNVQPSLQCSALSPVFSPSMFDWGLGGSLGFNWGLGDRGLGPPPS
jgi:hypothetical protein